MKDLYYKSLATAFLVFATVTLFANDAAIYLSGKVVDSSNGETLPFAHIVVNNIGTTTNLDGEFSISFKRNDLSQELKVSFIGYESFKQNISSSASDVIIELTPNSKELEEVIVYSADHVIRDIFNFKHVNYEFEDQQLTSYYKEILKSSSTYFYLAEGILDIYLPTVFSKDNPIIHPLKSRKKEFLSLDSLEMTYVTGNARDMLNSITRRKDSFIDMTQVKNYVFTKDKLLTYDDREVFKIDFEPKNRKATTRGTLYVDVESHAVIKAEYYPLIENQNFWTNVEWVEEYVEVNSTWYLSRVSYLGEWLQDGNSMSFESLLVVTNFEKAKEKPDYDIKLSSKDTFLDYVSDFSESFWDGLNHIKLSLDETKMVTKNF